MTQQLVLWYFADPMCSSCWGFAPVMSAIKEKYSDRFRIALVLGGLRPGTTERVMHASCARYAVTGIHSIDLINTSWCEQHMCRRANE